MLSSSVWRDGSRWWFSTGLLLGGLTSGLLAVLLGSLLLQSWLPDTAATAIVAAVFVLVLFRELGLLKFPLPQNARQVPLSIAEQGGQYGPLQFGFEMGTGVRTYMTSGLPHALLVALFLVADAPAALMAGLAFGAGRALMTVSRHEHRDVDAWDLALARFERPVRLILMLAATGTVGAILIGSL